MKLIDKTALVAEIERLRKNRRLDDRHEQGVLDGLHAIEKYINTLEVKEVDLDWQDIYSILYIERIVIREFGDKEFSNEELCLEVLKRFKAQKGEKVWKL